MKFAAPNNRFPAHHRSEVYPRPPVFFICIGIVLPCDHVGGYLSIESETKVSGSLNKSKQNPLRMSPMVNSRVGHVPAEMIDCSCYVRACEVRTIAKFPNHPRKREQLGGVTRCFSSSRASCSRLTMVGRCKIISYTNNVP